MRLNNRTNLYLIVGMLVFTAFICMFTICFAENSQTEKSGGNTKCYVCHPALKAEELTTSHLDMDITCDECHGPSIEHMHDEMLMTKPDLLFGRSEVNKMCSNPSCHKPSGERSVYGLHDHDSVAVEVFIKKLHGRIRPNGRAVTHDSVCTDCHGTHNITDEIETPSDEKRFIEWVAAFNGRDLTGWRSSGNASWSIKNGRIIASPGANGEGGVLWTDAVYEDYLLAITFQATWPIHAGIWLRGASSKNSPRVEIFDNPKTSAYTGSVWVPEKGLALVNQREDLVDHEGWNTLSVKVEEDRIQVWLNGEEIGAVRVSGPVKGKIGLYVVEHSASKSTELHIREVLVQQLAETVEKAVEPD